MVATKKSFREFINTSGGKIAGSIGCIVLVVVAVYEIHSFMSPDATVAFANDPLFIDSETGKTFRVPLRDGMTIPVVNPSTGKATGYKAELCYWTKDGKPKTDPTPVLMNDDVGKPGPTFCPDCGRLVVHHNPMAKLGWRPPPTEAEWHAQHDN
jgi:hypothetical protein